VRVEVEGGDQVAVVVSYRPGARTADAMFGIECTEGGEITLLTYARMIRSPRRRASHIKKRMSFLRSRGSFSFRRASPVGAKCLSSETPQLVLRSQPC
jgi:hypothetical protein